jgi:signal transduction histidine kinase
MEKVAQIQQLLLRSKRLPWVVIGLALVILGGTILVGRQQLREKIRGQLIERDGEILHAVALMHLQEFEEDASSDLLGAADSKENLLTVLLKTTRLKGVLAARLFDPNGRFIEAFPADAIETDLAVGDLSGLKQGQPVNHFHAAGRLSQIFLTAADEPAESAVPLLEVNVPLHLGQKDRLLGIAQFIIEGQSLAAQFGRVDRNLTFQALAAFGVSGALLVAALFWAFRRLRHAHGLLEERTDSLLQANQELALAAKTSAVGAVTSHLIHGLKSPLSGLQTFMNSLNPAQGSLLMQDWEHATAITRRMQILINQVVSVLREEQGFRQYELTLADLSAIINARMEPLARQKGVQFFTQCDLDEAVPNRTANLITLVLMNLVQNAIEATPSGRSVRISYLRTADRLVCEVHDEGPGLPDSIKSNLFSPCHSSNEHGSGIGLAISKQLANHLGADLELKSSHSAGCVFSLTLPACSVSADPKELV